MPASKYKNHVPKRRETIPDSVRTPGKDDAAQAIDAVIESGAWPVDLQDIARESGWSRQHIANTLEDYYTLNGHNDNGHNDDEENDEIAVPSPKGHEENVVFIDVPSNVENLDDYLQGYFSGWLDGKEDLDL